MFALSGTDWVLGRLRLAGGTGSCAQGRDRGVNSKGKEGKIGKRKDPRTGMEMEVEVAAKQSWIGRYCG